MMLDFPRRATLFAGAAFAAAVLAVNPAAEAGFAQLLFTIEVSDGGGAIYSDSYNPAAMFNVGGGSYMYNVTPVTHGSFHFDPNFTVASGHPVGLFPANIFAGFTFQNTSGDSLQVVVTLTVLTDFPGAGGIYDWTTQASMIQGTGTVAALNGSIFSAFIDGANVSQHFAGSFLGPSGTPTPFEQASGLTGIPASSLSIEFAFSISAGSQVYFDGNIAVVPAPAGLALLAMGGFACVNRRRRR